MFLSQPSVLSPSKWWHRCDVNLAPFRYDRILRKDGGPIDRLEKAVLRIREGSVFAFNAYLHDGLRKVKRSSRLFGFADGESTHRNEMVARFRAISEAIERWAYFDHFDSNLRDIYGFDIDSTTTGMAAFPGLLHSRARHAARVEGVGRFALQHWWEGRLEHAVGPGHLGCRAVHIKLPFPDIQAALVFEDDPVAGTTHYGYAAGSTLSGAVARAHDDLVQHRIAIQDYIERNPSPEMGLVTLSDTLEKRSVFFALKAGRRLFGERLESGPWAPLVRPKQVYHGWIPGPWDQYATVWRCLFEPASDEPEGARMDYFYW